MWTVGAAHGDDGEMATTIGMTLDTAVEKYGDRVATNFHGGAVTYRQLQQTSDQLARGFLSVGVAKGDKVAIWMAGYAEWAYVYFALARIGAVMVAVNTRYRPEEIEYVLNKSRASLLICKDEPNKNYLALLQELAPGVGRIENALPAAKLPFLKQVVVASERPWVGCMTFAELAKRGESVADNEWANAARKVGSDDIAMIQFTSGTTALPKGAMLFQAAMLRGAQCGCRALQLTESDRFFSPQPFFHVGGSIQVMLTPII